MLGHIDRGVGRLIGDPTFDESYEDARSGEEESKTNDNLEATAGGKGEDNDMSLLLSQELSWLPNDAFKHITHSSLVPRVIVAEKEVNEAPPPLFKCFYSRIRPTSPGIPIRVSHTAVSCSRRARGRRRKQLT